MADDTQEVRVSTFAQVSDVAAELGQGIEVGDPRYLQIERWIARAERQIRARIPQLNEWAQDPEYRELVADIETVAVARKALNPEGIRSIMTQIDDANIQKTIDSSRSVGEVIILDSEWDQLFKLTQGDLTSVTVKPDADSVPLPAYPLGY